MKKILEIVALLFFILILSACKKESIKTENLNSEILSIAEDEILADIYFAELLDEGDDGIFLEDDDFISSKSAFAENYLCPEMTLESRIDKWIVTLDFSGECEQDGEINIEYYKLLDDKAKKKRIIFNNFKNSNGVTFIGNIVIVYENGNNKVDSYITSKKMVEKKMVEITRHYIGQIQWVCGLNSKNRQDDIKEVTGESEVTKTIDGAVARTYSRKILTPLLFVNNCDLKVQRGTVKIEKDGAEIEINCGEIPEEINCDTTITCNSLIEITKDGKTDLVTFEDGKIIK